jgi:hypothetical protein
MKAHPRYSQFLIRADNHISTLAGHIPDSSSKHISESDEIDHLRQLQVDSPEDYCRYQTCRVYYYLKKTAFKRIDIFELSWDLDDCGRYWLVGARIYKVVDDLDESKLAQKIEQHTKKTNEYLTPLMEMLTAKVHHRLKLLAFDHFASIVDLIDTLGLPHATTISLMLPHTTAIESLMRMARHYTRAKDQGDTFDVCGDRCWQSWIDDVYGVLYVSAVPAKRVPDLHGNQLDQHAHSIKTTFSRLIINQFPSLSYIFSNKSENAYIKAKAEKHAGAEQVKIRRGMHNKSMSSLNASRLVGRYRATSKILDTRSKSRLVDNSNDNVPVGGHVRLDSR